MHYWWLNKLPISLLCTCSQFHRDVLRHLPRCPVQPGYRNHCVPQSSVGCRAFLRPPACASDVGSVDVRYGQNVWFGRAERRVEFVSLWQLVNAHSRPSRGERSITPVLWAFSLLAVFVCDFSRLLFAANAVLLQPAALSVTALMQLPQETRLQVAVSIEQSSSSLSLLHKKGSKMKNNKNKMLVQSICNFSLCLDRREDSACVVEWCIQNYMDSWNGRRRKDTDK